MKPVDKSKLFELLRINPERQSMRTWVVGEGRYAVRVALGANDAWADNRQKRLHTPEKLLRTVDAGNRKREVLNGRYWPKAVCQAQQSHAR